MAMLNKLIVAAAAFASLVSAVPYNQQWKRPQIITETAVTTVNVAVTVWVDENGRVFSTDYPSAASRVMPSTSVIVTSSTVATIVSSSSPSSASPSVPKATTSEVVAPVVTTPAAAPSTTLTTQAAPTTSAYVAPAAPTTVKTTTAAASTISPVSNAVSGSTRSTPDGPCVGSASNCVGDITHWDGGLGACGWNVDSNSQMQIALPVGLMGPLSNSNPYCGQSVTVKNPNTGATMQATVGDKCMGCTGYSIDLTNALFNAIGGGCDGRCGGFQWWFN